MARDLTKHMTETPFEAALEHVLLPIHKGAAVMYEEHYVLMPHKLWSIMYKYDSGLFERHFLGGQANNASKFWKGMRGSKLNEKLELLQLDPSKTIPLKIFGDGIACTGLGKSWSKSAETFHFASLLSTSSSKVSEAPGQDNPHQVCFARILPKLS